jgi:hypothetical protein
MDDNVDVPEDQQRDRGDDVQEPAYVAPGAALFTVENETTHTELPRPTFHKGGPVRRMDTGEPVRLDAMPGENDDERVDAAIRSVAYQQGYDEGRRVGFTTGYKAGSSVTSGPSYRDGELHAYETGIHQILFVLKWDGLIMILMIIAFLAAALSVALG